MDLNTAATQSTMGGGRRQARLRTWRPSYSSTNLHGENGDVYAYGMIVFEVLTGDTPWSASIRCKS